MSSWDSLALAIGQFHFLRPGWFLVIPVMLFLMWRLQQRENHNDWQHFIDSELLDAVLLRGQEQHWLTPRRLAGVMFVLSVVILCGPSWQKQQSPLTDDTAPLVIALSLDESMLEQDLSPNRLHHAKQKIQTLLQHRRGAPTALVVYAGSSHSVLPLTEDTELLNFYLSELSPEVMPQPGNQPQQALNAALNLLQEQAGSIVFVAADWPMQGGWQQTPPDHVAISLLAVQPQQPGDSSLIQQARSMQLTGIELSPDDSDIEQLLSAIQNHWVTQQQSDDNLAWVDAGYYLLWPLFALMLIWFRRGMVLQW